MPDGLLGHGGRSTVLRGARSVVVVDEPMLFVQSGLQSGGRLRSCLVPESSPKPVRCGCEMGLAQGMRSDRGPGSESRQFTPTRRLAWQVHCSGFRSVIISRMDAAGVITNRERWRK